MGKTDAYYFSHDSNALTDQKILAMRCDYGLEGYGLYWAIIEMLRNEGTYKLPLDKNTYRAIKMQTGTTIDIERFISDGINEYIGASNNGLFNSDGNYFWSESLLQRMEKVETTREKRSEAGKKGMKNRWQKNNKKTNYSKIKIKGYKKNITKKDKVITFVNKTYNKVITNAIKKHSKVISKNNKRNEMKRNEMKRNEIKSIYPSTHTHTKNLELNILIDEMDKTDKQQLEEIIINSGINYYEKNLCEEVTEIITEMYFNPDTREKIKKINSKRLEYAIHNFAVENSKQTIQIPKSYFKKCILSAIDQTALSEQYDLNTIYKNMV